MKKTILATLAIALFAFSAHAKMTITEETYNCADTAGKYNFQVHIAMEGSYEELVDKGEALAAGVTSLTKGAQQITLKGTANNSARGAYYELKNGATQLFISAPASGSPSELIIGQDKAIELDCQ